jgi:RimJ/RimL family protein N-acetyltransferase
MIGFVGLQYVNFEASFTPAVEIGWRLAYEYWGRGYATEAARAVLDHAFKQLKLSEVVAFTVVSNRQSRKVMQKIGMRYDPQGDFDHPDFDHNSPLRRHVLYRVSKEQA